jgi:alpha/beta superfamily hydrolase
MGWSIPAPHGRLEILHRVPTTPVAGAVLLCHPHPLHGGTMHTRTLHHAARALEQAGLATLRFNFRGVGRSTGVHDGGRGELEDARLALEHLVTQHPQAHLLVLGFSFGAWVGFRAAVPDTRVSGIIGLAVPFDTYDFAFLEEYRRPKLLLHGEHDELASLDRCQEVVARLAPPKTCHILRGAGHLLEERLPEVRDRLAEFVSQALPPGATAPGPG